MPFLGNITFFFKKIQEQKILKNDYISTYIDLSLLILWLYNNLSVNQSLLKYHAFTCLCVLIHISYDESTHPITGAMGEHSYVNTPGTGCEESFTKSYTADSNLCVQYIVLILLGNVDDRGKVLWLCSSPFLCGSRISLLARPPPLSNNY